MPANLTNDNSILYGLPQLKLSLMRRADSKSTKISCAKDVLNFLMPLKMACDEYFLTVHLNPKLEIIGIHEVSHGTLTNSFIHPRELFKAACLANTHSLILCHNHPSGSLEPSNEDLNLTIRLINAANLMGFIILDHLIVGGGKMKKYYSFREDQNHLWDNNF